MIDDICLLCRINSEKMAYQEGKPYGEGASSALALALAMAEKYGFSINNYDNYVGTADLNDEGEAARYPGPSGCGSGRRGMDGDGAL